MTRTLDEFATALESGDSDEINAAIDELDDMDRERKAVVFDDLFEMCRRVYSEGDGYQRQSVVRFLDSLVPPLGYPEELTTRTDDRSQLPDDAHEPAEYRERLLEFFSETMVDDDGRVRRATVRALKQLCVAADMANADAELEAIRETLDELAAHRSGSKRDHIEEVIETVEFHRRSFGIDGLSTLLDELTETERE